MGGSDFYEKTFALVDADPQRRVPLETYDEDLGQAGWLQAAEALRRPEAVKPEAEILSS